MNLNTLKDALDQAGSKVQKLQNKQSDMAVEMSKNADAYSNEDLEKFNNDLDNAKKAQDFAKVAYENEKANMEKAPKIKPVVDEKTDPMDIRNQFVKDFKNVVTSGKTGSGNAGLTIPDDIQLTIRTLTRQFTSLEGLVSVENVGTTNGSRVYEKLSDITPLANLDDEAGAIGDNDDPELTVIKYLIHRYAGITTITNTLLKDTVDNIMTWLTNWVAKKDVITRNQEILKVMGTAPKKPTITNFDDIKDLQLNTLDPAIISTSSFITNQSGFAILSKAKDAEGRYMIQPSVTNPEVYQIGGKSVTVIGDKFLPDVSGAHPIYYGDLKQAITLYDRQQMQIDTTNSGAGAFEHDLTKLRFIDRFDVELIDDGAFVAGSFKAVADQTPATPSGK